MGNESGTGCVTVAEGPIDPEPKAADKGNEGKSKIEEKMMQVMVGKAAPDFGAMAFFEGGFKPVKLSDYRGKWVFLCFYPGDFTFV